MKLNIDRITLLRAFLVTQMNHWTFFPLYVTCIVVAGDIVGTGTPLVLLWLALGALPFLLYLGRQMLQKFWALALLHLTMIAIMFLIPGEHIVIRILYVCVGLLYVIYSFYLWASTTHRQDPKCNPMIATGTAFVMLYILHEQKHSEWDAAFVTTLIIVLGIYFISYYIEQYQNFLKVNRSSAGHIPSTEMFRSGMGLVMGYTGIGIVILVLVSNIEWLKGILNIIKKALVSCLNFILALFPQSSDAPMPEYSDVQNLASMEGMDMLVAEETFWLWNVLEYVVVIAFLAAIVILLIKGFLFLIKFIRSKMKGLHPQFQNTSEEEVVDVREKCDIVKRNEWKMKLPFLSMNPRERIRQQYKKYILSSRNILSQGNDTLLNRYTARESGRILEREEFAAIYEKARYSNEECDSEDVKRMRNACK